MVTIGEVKQYVGTSEDTKPTDKFVPINAMFLELDTGDFYYFDGEDWLLFGSGGGDDGDNPK